MVGLRSRINARAKRVSEIKGGRLVSSCLPGRKFVKRRKLDLNVFK